MKILPFFLVSVLVLALGMAALAPSSSAEPVSMKCWKCGAVFEADDAETIVRCPACNSKCQVPPKQAPEEAKAPGEEPQALTWQEAMTRKGRFVVVEAVIVNIYDPAARGRKGPVKLNTDRDYKKSLSFALNNADNRFGDPGQYRNQTVRVRGTVSDYRGAMEIKVEKPSDITIVSASSGQTAAAEKEAAPSEATDAEFAEEGDEEADAGGEKAAAGVEEAAAGVEEADAGVEEAAAGVEEAAAEPAGKAMSWQEAMNRIGETVTVEATVVNVYDPEAKGKTGPVKLNTDRDWDNSLTIVFFKAGRDGGDAGFPPPSQFLNRKVRVTGKVAEYKGAKQIMLSGPDQIAIVP